MTCILSFDRARDRFVHLELIIVRQFFARADVAQGMDKDATIVFLDRFAVRVAGVVDPTRFVPADLGVDDVGAIVDPKKKCVHTVHIGWDTFPRDAATRVFNDAPALSDGSGSENAPTVNSRLTHLNERHGEEARCASVNGPLLSIIESKELAKVSSPRSRHGCHHRT